MIEATFRQAIFMRQLFIWQFFFARLNEKNWSISDLQGRVECVHTLEFGRAEHFSLKIECMKIMNKRSQY